MCRAMIFHIPWGPDQWTAARRTRGRGFWELCCRPLQQHLGPGARPRMGSFLKGAAPNGVPKGHTKDISISRYGSNWRPNRPQKHNDCRDGSKWEPKKTKPGRSLKMMLQNPHPVQPHSQNVVLVTLIFVWPPGSLLIQNGAPSYNSPQTVWLPGAS